MGMPWCKHANNHAVRVLSMSSLVITGLFGSFIYANTTPGVFSTMSIKMRASISKDKLTSRAIITTATMPKEQQSEQLAKSPCTAHINSVLAEINLPLNQFANVLEALRPSTSPMDDGPNNPGNLTPPTNKKMQVTQLASPTGVDEQEIGFHTPVNNASPPANEPPNTQTTPPSRSVRINKTATLAATTANSSGGISQGHQ
jgi:hypothetical protein